MFRSRQTTDIDRQSRHEYRRGLVLLGYLVFALLVAAAGEARAADAADQVDELKRLEYRQRHMGMQVRLVLYAANEPAADRAASAAFDRIAQLENVLSRWRDASELNQLCARAGEGPVSVSEDLFAVLRQAQALSRRSDGAFDITVGPLVALWREARETHRLPEPEVLQQARERVGWQKLQLDSEARTAELRVEGMQLDLGGIAKGYILDRALEELKRQGVQRALVEAGGEIVVGDPPPGRSGWKIRVPGAGPDGTDKAVELACAAISTSGDAMQFVEIEGQRYSHVVDPRTGLGLINRTAVTVIAPDSLTADGLATTLGVLGPVAGHALVEAWPRQPLRVWIRPSVDDAPSRSFPQNPNRAEQSRRK